jgi:lipoprotein-releasing system permease protein
MHSLLLTIRIARTHLLAKKRQTMIASLGVTFGIAMFILMISFMTGVNKVLEDTMLSSTPHIKIFHDVETHRPSLLQMQETNSQKRRQWNIIHHMRPKDEQLNLKNGFIIADRIAHEPGILGVSAQVGSQVFYNNGPTQITGSLSGVNIADEDKLYGLKGKIKTGSIETFLSGKDVILMGQGLADKLNVTTGDKVSVATPFGTTKLLRIAGTYKYGIGVIDNSRSYASIQTVQKLLAKKPDYVSELHIKLTDLNDARPRANRYQGRFGYKAEDWETANASILVSFTIRNILTYVVVATLLIVAGFGIYNIMNMTVYDKMKDIAILKATGFEGHEIVGIFLMQSVFIGIFGGLLGLLLGFVLSYTLSKTPFNGGEFLSIDTFPVNMDPKFYVFGIVFGIITTVLAGYFPAKKASKIDPVKILRG